MKVKMLDSGAVVEAGENYAIRLIEQGKAVIPPKGEPEATGETAEAEAKPEAEAAEEPEPEKPAPRKKRGK